MNERGSSNANGAGNSNGRILLAILLLGITVALFFATRGVDDRKRENNDGSGEGNGNDADPATLDPLAFTETAFD